MLFSSFLNYVTVIDFFIFFALYLIKSEYVIMILEFFVVVLFHCLHFSFQASVVWAAI